MFNVVFDTKMSPLKLETMVARLHDGPDDPHFLVSHFRPVTMNRAVKPVGWYEKEGV